MIDSPLILVADDDADIRLALSMLLNANGFKAIESSSLKETVILAQRFKPSLILLDMNFHSDTTSGQDGLSVLPQLINDNHNVVLMTAWATIELAVKGLQLGALDFIEKPWNNQSLIDSITRHLSASARGSGTAVNATKGFTKESISRHKPFFNSTSMTAINDLIQRVAPSDANILITGENGVGKSQLAQYIHSLSLRADKPFVPVNMAAIPETLFESELFGHKKGAFTDAKADRHGRFKEAHTGTIFLDEIGTIPLNIQPKLLHVLETKSYVPVGARLTEYADTRIISATNEDLDAHIGQQTFRQDLYFRLNTIVIDIPPLRQRLDDIEPLALDLVNRFANKYNQSHITFTEDALTLLRQLPWPGNIRELSNVIERCVLMCSDHIIDKTLIESLIGTPKNISSDTLTTSPKNLTLDDIESLETIELKMIQRALEVTRGNQSEAAKLLDISRHALSRRIDKFGISLET
ncbi:sigma-54-dependent transcriptional regulator [Psychrosphaera haliotis]|uniref:sigma-54-dependent transcriptional regulator n=1 Tax=Psychrosphaera haliotis TaxID=555083 RepID=UPI001E4B3022|nr:sigma-54 dependent transcriptional regulator [Psychrosphaera haliotis]